MQLDRDKHKSVLLNLLKDIYADPRVGPFLGFKGGTAATMFYGLDRFSVDLDFDLLRADKAEQVLSALITIAGKYGKIKDQHQKHFGLICALSYADQATHIKIDVSTRPTSASYELRTHLGISMLVMNLADMVAHKLLAMSERWSKTSRDIFDVWFFLSKISPINEQIIIDRAGQTFAELAAQCIKDLQKISEREVLRGLGELLTEPQKDWARDKLIEETIAQLRIAARI